MREQLNKVIALTQHSYFSRSQRKQTGLTVHEVNILINIYLLQVIKKQDKIKIYDIVAVNNYLSSVQIKQRLNNNLVGYVYSYIDKRIKNVGSYYVITDKGICLVEDILNNYDLRFREYLEKHKLNELF